MLHVSRKIMLSTTLLRMFGFAIGTAIYGFLAALLLRKNGKQFSAWAVLAVILGAFAWYAAGAAAAFHQAGAGTVPGGDFARTLESTSAGGLLLAGIAVAGAAVVWMAGTPITDSSERKFRRAIAAAIAVSAAGAFAGSESALVVLAGLAPAVCLVYFILRFNVLGLRISRRMVFATALGGLSAVYLLIVRRIADFAQEEFAAFGGVIEALLILAAVGVWVPLYAWMNRATSRPAQLYAEFGRRLIQDAAAIFDLDQRLAYIARELGRTFRLRRVLLAATDAPRILMARFPVADDAEVPLARMAEEVREKRFDGVATLDTHPELLRASGFNYLFPLWYEDRLVGLLLADTAPKRYLDENETILLGLSRQISHSIESCRLVEGKIGLEKALARSEHMAALGQMAATIAHEVKNPLSSIKTLGQFMQEDQQISEDHRRDLSFIVAETNRLNSCVEQLLTFSRPFPEQREDVVLPALFQDISRALNREYGGQGIRVQADAPPDLVLKNVDVQSLHQIVLNLALNALQASPPGEIVELKAAPRNGSVAITVTDGGAGVRPELRDKIFEPFFTTKQKGSGLGLAIVFKNVRHLGGHVRVESPARGGRGTAMIVTLPLEIV